MRFRPTVLKKTNHQDAKDAKKDTKKRYSRHPALAQPSEQRESRGFLFLVFLGVLAVRFLFD
jgi:hypothetical protein